jgi:hypothetical protein
MRLCNAGPVGAPWSAAPIASVPRHASRAIAFSNFHKPATVDLFTIAPGNLNAVFTPKLVALGSAPAAIGELLRGHLSAGDDALDAMTALSLSVHRIGGPTRHLPNAPPVFIYKSGVARW